MLKIFDIFKKNSPYKNKQCLEILNVKDISEEDEEFVLNEISKYIFEYQNDNKKTKKIFDLNLDFKYYYPDFLKYGINLFKDDISWWEFDALLDFFMRIDNSSISNMLSFRLYEKPSNNQKIQEQREHKYRMNMKKKYALKQNEIKEDSLGKLWNILEKKIGEKNERC